MAKTYFWVNFLAPKYSGKTEYSKAKNNFEEREPSNLVVST